MKQLLVPVLVSLYLLTSPTAATAQTSAPSDSISSCSVRAADFILPVSLVAVGATGCFEPVRTWKKDLRDWVQTKADGECPVDNYLQYAPLATVFVADWCGADAKHDFTDRFVLTFTTFVTYTVLTNGVVDCISDVMAGLTNGQRPGNHDSRNSFPSGHAGTAFLGAELVRMEYGEDYPWLAVGAYTVAAGVGVMRVWNDWHWATDVVAGAGMGILSARLCQLAMPALQRTVSPWMRSTFPFLTTKTTCSASPYGGMLTFTAEW